MHHAVKTLENQSLTCNDIERCLVRLYACIITSNKILKKKSHTDLSNCTMIFEMLFTSALTTDQNADSPNVKIHLRQKYLPIPVSKYVCLLTLYS